MSKVKFYHLNLDAFDSEKVKHTITVVGKLEQKYVKEEVNADVPVEIHEGKVVRGNLTFNKRTLDRRFTVAYAICSPEDEFDEQKGIEIAKKRIEKGDDIGTVMTNNVTMLTEDLCYYELLGKISYIAKNIDKYIKKKC